MVNACVSVRQHVLSSPQRDTAWSIMWFSCIAWSFRGAAFIHSSHEQRERGEPCRWETRPCLLLLVIKLLWDELHSLRMDWK